MQNDFRIETGTVGIAIWDTAHLYEGPAVPPKELTKAISNFNNQTERGDLFFVYTGINETFPVKIVVNEQIDPAILTKYQAHSDAWLLRCPSGKVSIGDLVDFRDQAHRFKGGQSTFSINPGDYRLTVFEFDFDGGLRTHLGETRYKKYFFQLRRNKVIGLIGIGVVITSFVIFRWYVSLISLLLFILAIFAIINNKEHQETAQLYADFSETLSLPYFIICLSNSETLPTHGGKTDRKLTFPASLGRVQEEIRKNKKTDNDSLQGTPHTGAPEL